MLTIEQLNSNALYWHILEAQIKPPTAISKWISEFPFLHDNDFRNFYILPFKVLRDTKLQTFQYKLINRVIPCGAALQIWKLAESGNCKFCDEYDNLSHHFFDCPNTKSFWAQLTEWIKGVTDISVPLSKVDVLFGVPLYDTFMTCLNFIVLYAKSHIHKYKLKNEEPFLLDYLVELKNEIDMERLILTTNGKKETFDLKWSMFYEFLF